MLAYAFFLNTNFTNDTNRAACAAMESKLKVN